MPARRPSFEGLPYEGALGRLIAPLYDAFLALNRWYTVPAIRLGLAPLHSNPLTGSWLLLRTTGRRSGRIRQAPLGYAILDGCVYVCAGFGAAAHWYRNLLAEPRVEVVLPSAAFAGVAEEVTDPAELDRAWRALIRALGALGTTFVCPADAPAETLRAKTRGLPLVRIRPTGIAAGPADPGGLLWLTLAAVGLGWLLRRLSGILAPRRRS